MRRLHPDPEVALGRPLDLLTFAEGDRPIPWRRTGPRPGDWEKDLSAWSGPGQVPGVLGEGIALYPKQRLIFKCLQNWVIDPGNSVPLNAWEEEELARMLSRDDPENLAVLRDNPNSNQPFAVLMVMGRGGSKTTMVGVLEGFLAYRLARLENPQGAYGLAALKPLKIAVIATSESTAGEAFDIIRTVIEQNRLLSLLAKAPLGEKEIVFPRKLDILKKASTSRGGRGGDVFSYAYDEMAFARENEGSDASAAELYRAYHNATESRFHRAGVEAFFSSPGAKAGMFHSLYQSALNPPEQDGLERVALFQCATWNIKPGEHKEAYQAKARRDPVGYLTENAAQFVGVKHGFLEPELVDQMVKPTLRRLTRGLPNVEYVLHVDPSKRWDRYALLLLYRAVINGDDHFIVAHGHHWDGRADGKPVRVKAVEAYIKWLCQRFNVRKITFDQFNSQSTIQNLEDVGLPAEETPFTEKYNYLIYRNLETHARQGTVWTYPCPELTGELKALERHNKGRRYIDENGKEKGMLFSASAPTSGEVTTDDYADCLAGALYQASLLSLRPAWGSHMDVLLTGNDHKTFLDAPIWAGETWLQLGDGGPIQPGYTVLLAGIPYEVAERLGHRVRLADPLLTRAEYGAELTFREGGGYAPEEAPPGAMGDGSLEDGPDEADLSGAELSDTEGATAFFDYLGHLAEEDE